MKPARIIVICVAAVAAIGLALVVRAMGSPSNSPTAVATAAAVPARPMAKVLVAAKDLQPGQRLTEADLAWKDWPVDEVNPAFITDGTTPLPSAEAAGGAAPAARPEGAVASVTRAASNLATGGAKADYVGSVVREPILAGEPIVGRKIVRAGDSGYMAAYLEPGMRAMAIRVTVETAAGGFILPGDRVDVLLTRETTLGNMGAQEGDRSKFASSTVMQNIKVLAIDQSTRAGDDEQAVVGATATLEVGPRDAEALALAKSEGELSLVLRSYADTGGPSGRVAPVVRQSSAIRVYRGGAPEVVVVQ
ncbi:MAG: Flp pilus assembly protein CpaB [Alphaproteobacteria bacterium]|uniref:Flp pilus assembly protein CpaB n=1 Tax=Brevundimonas sp. TaxID=1871086 RepID=UPI0017B6B31E|nr:Flp pilus assembly protein CpaB [Brevundimonas sp.]MBA3049652.1 Flp pilus assembly protein CpaB [Brevundimonas sp.]MBU3975255.1 Flp pilus assembly protein CpaB [Alphaproteobacteria bacterium]MBU4039024.1 Flp pilus assembly protein CpaB [Alphaproteobacteria bacterium]MBU4137770.1 Flp pilus assembly protein CpaB [Alphaproteobacteria bacterium]